MGASPAVPKAPSIGEYQKHHLPNPSRCSAPSEAFVLWPSVLRATIPLRPRFVPLCGLRFINASPRCRPRRLLASLRWLHIVFIPSAAQGLLLPFAATVAHGRCQRKRTPSDIARVPRPDDYLSLRRADDDSASSAVVSSLRFSRRQVAGHITASMLYDENKPHPPQSVARLPPQNACALHFAANSISPTPYEGINPSLLAPSIL